MYGRSVKKPNPCYQCTDRKIGCHSDCKKHNDWKLENIDQRRQMEQYIDPPQCHYFKDKPIRNSAKRSKKRYR